MKSGAIKDCPTAAGIVVNPVNSPYAYATNYYYLNSAYYPGTTASPIPRAYPSLTMVEQPSETIFLADCAGFATTNGVYGLARLSQLNVPSRSASAPNVHGRHSSRANVSWIDGHATSMPVTTRKMAYNQATSAMFDANSVGDLLKGGIRDDYYFELTKTRQQ